MSLEHLEISLSIFFAKNYKEIYLLDDLLSPEKFEVRPDQEKHLESLVTHTYYYLAQVMIPRRFSL